MLLALVAAATLTIGIDGVLAEPTTELRAQTRVAILLPNALPVVDRRIKLHATGSGSRDRYTFRLTTTPDCDANFCYVATFSARKGKGRMTGRAIGLAKGRKGRFHPMSCGASCSPASITWRERGATYTLEAMIPLKADQRAALRKLANSAIKRGPR